MKLFHTLLFVTTMVLGGCSLSVTDKAIIAANEIHNLAAGEAEIILDYCTPKYQTAKTKIDVEAIDKICLPAEASYYTVRTAWQTLATTIEACKAGKATEAQVQTALTKLNTAATDLQKKLAVLNSSGTQ